MSLSLLISLLVFCVQISISVSPQLIAAIKCLILFHNSWMLGK